MTDIALVSPEDQRVTFVELFFDLVFVFCVTQVVQLLGQGVTPAALGEAVLVFWLVWWGWTQYTWALNAADTTHPLIALATLLATAVAFFLAIAIPGAFHGGGLAFAVSYVLVRGIGLLLYGEVASAAAPEQHAAVKVFTVLSLGGLAAVLAGGFFTGPAQYALWTAAIVLDLVAALVGGRAEGWNLHPEHFAERHGLFVIIALGESLIVAGAGVAGEDWDAATLLVAIPAVAVTCALWWTYFVRSKPRLDKALERTRGRVQSEMGRDVFSLIHFPILCGVIAYAAFVEYAVHHPTGAPSTELRLLLAAGLLLFLGGMAAATWRATRLLLAGRLVVAALGAAAIAAFPLRSPAGPLLVALAAAAVVGALEQRRPANAVGEAGRAEVA